MAVDYDKPTITDSRSGVWEQVRENIDAIAKMQKGVAASNTPTNTVKFEGNVFSRYDGSTFNIEALAVAGGGTGATSAASARTNLGTDNADNITSGTLGVSRLPTVTVAKGGTGATSASGARTNLGLGTLAVLNSGSGSGDVRLNSDNEAKFMDPTIFGSNLVSIPDPTIDFTADLTGGTPSPGFFEIVFTEPFTSSSQRFYTFLPVSQGVDVRQVIFEAFDNSNDFLHFSSLIYSSSDVLNMSNTYINFNTNQSFNAGATNITSIKRIGF